MLFVTCGPGLEDLLEKELKGLKIEGIKRGYSGLFVPQTIENVYLINYLSRIATRVLWPLKRFACKDRHDLYEQAKKIGWDQFLTVKKTFAIDSNVNHPELRNSLFASLVVKDAICDFIRDKVGARPSVQIQNPDVQLNLFIQGGFATISLDTSGAPLFKRGWRKEAGVAPLQESLAAAALAIAGYQADNILLDPFCGSGTILMEAAMMATKTPSGFFRKSWGFIHLPDHREEIWQKIKREADLLKTELGENKIFGVDKDPQVLELSRAHLEAAGFHNVTLEKADIRSYFPKTKAELVVTNPPYGKRLQTSLEIYKALGKLIRDQRAYVLAPDEEHAHAINPQIKGRFNFFNGGTEIQLFHFT